MPEYYQVPYSAGELDKEKLREWVAQIAGESVVIYSAGYRGTTLYDYLSGNNVQVFCFCDRAEQQRRRPHCGVRVVAPDIIKDVAAGRKIVIALPEHSEEIRQSLLGYGIAPECVLLPPFTPVERFRKVPVATIAAEQAAANGWRRYTDSSIPVTRQFAADNNRIMMQTNVYNVPPYYLRRAIESVLGQTYGDFDYLLVNNGSTDGSSEIIAEYQRHDRRIQVVSSKNHHQMNEKELSERRVWFSNLHRKYEYLACLDSDDYYEPAFLEKTIALADKNNADMVIARTLIYQEASPEQSSLRPSPIGELVAADKYELAASFIKYGFYIASIWGKLYRSDFYLRSIPPVWVPVGYVGMSDWFTCHRRYLMANRVVYSDEVLHHWTNRAGTIVSTITTETLYVERCIAFYIYLRELLQENGYAVNDFSEVLERMLWDNALGREIELLEQLAVENAAMAKSIAQKVLAHDVFSSLPEDVRDDARVTNVIRRLQALVSYA